MRGQQGHPQVGLARVRRGVGGERVGRGGARERDRESRSVGATRRSDARAADRGRGAARRDVTLVTVGERRPRAVSIVLSCLTDAARFELSVGAKCHPLFKCIGAFSRVTTEHNDAREGAMPSNTLAAFAALVRGDARADARRVRGGELLVARGLLLPSPSPAFEIHASRNASLPGSNVVEGRAGRDAPEGTKSDRSPGRRSDRCHARFRRGRRDRRPQPRRSRDARPARSPRSRRARARADASPMTTREAFADQQHRASHAPRAAPVGARRDGAQKSDEDVVYLLHARVGPRVPRDPLACRADGLERARARQARSVVAGVLPDAVHAARARRSRSRRQTYRRARARARAKRWRFQRRRVARARATGGSAAVRRGRASRRAPRRGLPRGTRRRRRRRGQVSSRRTRAWRRISFDVGDAALPHWARAFVRKREIVASAGRWWPRSSP